MEKAALRPRSGLSAYVLFDAMRGIAAVAVVLFHLGCRSAWRISYFRMPIWRSISSSC